MVQTTLDLDDIEWLDERAKEENRSRADIVRTLLGIGMSFHEWDR